MPRPPHLSRARQWHALGLLAGLMAVVALACSAPVLPTASPAPSATIRVPVTAVPDDPAGARPNPAPGALPTDTPARRLVTPTPTAAATDTPPPTLTPSATPTIVFADPRYGVGASWGCRRPSLLPYFKMGVTWAYSWTPKENKEDLGMPAWVNLVRSVGDLKCAEGSPRNEYGWCLQTTITSPGDFAESPTLTETVRANPGTYWALGNEPNGHPNLGSIIPAEEYADWYHTMATIIRQNDPQARFLNGGLAALENAAGDIPQDEYADRFYRAYVERYGERPPVDIWSIHVYPDFDRPPQLYLDEFNAWRRSVGEEHLPLWVTEFAYTRRDISHQKVVDFMHEAVRAFAASGVERWFWYISHAGVGDPAIYLWYCDGTLTPAGMEYYRLAHGLAAP